MARDSTYRKQLQLRQLREYFYGSPKCELAPYSSTLYFSDISIRRIPQFLSTPTSTSHNDAKNEKLLDGTSDTAASILDIPHSDPSTAPLQLDESDESKLQVSTKEVENNGMQMAAPKEQLLPLLAVEAGDILLHTILAVSSLPLTPLATTTKSQEPSTEESGGQEQDEDEMLSMSNLAGFIHVYVLIYFIISMTSSSEVDVARKRIMALSPNAGKIPRRYLWLGNLIASKF